MPLRWTDEALHGFTVGRWVRWRHPMSWDGLGRIVGIDPYADNPVRFRYVDRRDGRLAEKTVQAGDLLLYFFDPPEALMAEYMIAELGA
jgi:hypothetical protein